MQKIPITDFVPDVRSVRITFSLGVAFVMIPLQLSPAIRPETVVFPLPFDPVINKCFLPLFSTFAAATPLTFTLAAEV